MSERRWTVYAGDLAVLSIRDQPGVLASTAPLDGGEPVQHPFLSATALDAGHEDHLRQVLDGATDLDGFLRALALAGYTVQPA